MNQSNLPLTPRVRSPRSGPTTTMNQEPVATLPPLVAPSTGVPAIPLPPFVEPPIQEPVAPLPPFVAPPAGEPVIPLPPFVEPPAGEPVIPLPPFVEPPVGEPVIPLPPFVEPPIQEPVATLPPLVAPSTGVPAIPLPPFVYPSQQPAFPGYCTVRFLHAAYGYSPLRVTISSRVVCGNLSFGGLSSYGRVPDGFYTVAVTTAAEPRSLLFQSTLPFRAGDVITMAITRTANGIDLTRISDAPCVSRPRDRACVRAVNLAYNSPALDVILNDGRVVFSDIRYKEATNFKLARPQEYGMYIAQTPYTLPAAYTDIETFESLPVILANYYLPGYGNVSPLASFYVDAKASGMYTIYILGAWNGAPAVSIKTVEDF